MGSKAWTSITLRAWFLVFTSRGLLSPSPSRNRLQPHGDQLKAPRFPFFGREWVWTVGNAGFVLCYATLLLMRTSPSLALLWFMVVAQGFLGYGLTSVLGAISAEIFHGRHYGGIFGT